MPLSEKQKLKMKQKRDVILKEAIGLFAELGYEGTTIKKVANAAEVSFGTVFTYFETKEALFHAAVTEPLEEYAAQMLNFDVQADEPLNELERAVRLHINVHASSGTYLNLVAHVVSHYKNYPETFEKLNQFHETLKEKILQLVQYCQDEGLLHKQDPKYVVTAYTSLLIGLRLNHTDGPDSDIWERFVPSALQLFRPESR